MMSLRYAVCQMRCYGELLLFFAFDLAGCFVRGGRFKRRGFNSGLNISEFGYFGMSVTVVDVSGPK